MRWLLGLALVAVTSTRIATSAVPITMPAPRVLPPPKRPVGEELMHRAYFRASSPVDNSEGAARWNNPPKRLATLTDAPVVEPGLHIVVQPEHERVLVINNSAQPISFNAQDSALDMVHEALDSTGRWGAIEYLPKVTCGNSSHDMQLAARSFWRFHEPRFHGIQRTQLRIHLTLTDDDGNQRHIYSNRFAGRVNPGQFSVRPERD